MLLEMSLRIKGFSIQKYTVNWSEDSPKSLNSTAVWAFFTTFFRVGCFKQNRFDPFNF